MDLPKSDRVIVAVSLVLLGFLFSLDRWLQYSFIGKTRVAKQIAVVSSIENIVKVKFPESFSFNATRKGEKLPSYTSVYSGPESQVELRLMDDSKITVGSEIGRASCRERVYVLV